MTYPHRPVPHPGTRPAQSTTPSTTWTVRRKPISAVPTPNHAMRRYEISYLADNGDEMDFSRSAPALPIFEETCGAFARGTLIPTALGPVAIEDLRPGMMIETLDGMHVPLRWIGAMTINPGAARNGAPAEHLLRIAADTFGLGRPAPDLILGAHARHLLRADSLKNFLGVGEALSPVSCLVDGMNVIEVTPISRVQTYHIALDRHALIRANGVEVETYHPGANTATKLMGDLRAQFLDMFPHIHEMADFGSMCYPRLSSGDLDHLNAA